MQSGLSYIGILILPGSVLLFARGIARLRTVLAFLNLSKQTTGVIVEAACCAEDQNVYLPTVEFQLTEKSPKIRFQGAVGRRLKSEIKIGKTVGVRYLPEKPEIARINTFGQLYGDALGMIAAGVIFALVALFLLGKLF
jgi:hypothetical protein